MSVLLVPNASGRSIDRANIGLTDFDSHMCEFCESGVVVRISLRTIAALEEVDFVFSRRDVLCDPSVDMMRGL